MNPNIRWKLLATALCGAALAGCNAVEDVREEPFTPVPAQGVVLEGRVTGTLGRQRAVTLINNGDVSNARSVSATLGAASTLFNFGIVPAGSAYNITVRTQPFGKICTVTGGTGTVTTAEALNITVNCVNDPAVPRYFVRVAIPADFAARANAKVILTTEEGVFERANIAPGSTFVQFDSAVFNNVVGGTVVGSPPTNITGGTTNTPTFTWAVTATTTEGSTVAQPLLNRCAITNGSNPLGNAAPYAFVALPPTGNIGVTAPIPTVGACTFTIGSAVGATGPAGVYYSTPAGGTPQTMPAGGLELQLRDVQGKVVETLTFNPAAGYGTSGTAAGTLGTGYTFTTAGRSNATAVYDVAVSRHPAGQTCVVHNGGAATLGVATANITNAHVACRANPAAPNRLRGTYGFLNGSTYNYANPIVTGTPVTTGVTDSAGVITNTTITATTLNTKTTYRSTTNPGLGGPSQAQDVVRDIRTRTVVTRTPPGGVAATVSDTTIDELGVVTANATITRNFLTFFEDGTFLHGVHGNNQVEHGFYAYNPTTRVISFTLIVDAFATPVFPATVASVNQAITLVSGLSATAVTAGGATTATMTNVVKTPGAESTLSGEFGTVEVYGLGAKWAKWVMAEPQSVAGQMTGTWVSRDHRRAWNYDFNTTLGFHTGVNGGAANMQDGCFTFENFRDPAGFYTRRGGLTGCLDAFTVPAGIGTVDFQLPTLTNTPGFVGRMPGTETAFDGRSPSPIYYAIGTPASFASVADPVYFPSTVDSPTTPAALSWCTTDVAGVRASLHGDPINTPVYFCRERAN